MIIIIQLYLANLLGLNITIFCNIFQRTLNWKVVLQTYYKYMGLLVFKITVRDYFQMQMFSNMYGA